MAHLELIAGAQVARTRHTLAVCSHQMTWKEALAMNRPHDYDEPRVTVRNINYHCEDDQFNAMHTTGGVLCKGQIV